MTGRYSQKAICTMILAAVNVAVFFFLSFQGMTEDAGFMLEHGAMYVPLMLEQGKYSPLFTSMFLHFGIEHLVNNMLVLFVLGSRLERVIGKWRFLFIYLAGGLLGNIISLTADLSKNSYTVSAGASGAVFGVMGAMIFVVIRNKGHLEDLSIKQILIMAVFSLYFGFASTGVDNAAHLGGLASGFILAAVAGQPRRRI